MSVAVVALGTVAVVLAVLGSRWRGARDRARAEVAELRDRLDSAQVDVTAADDAAATARRERDDALERATRARREASEVTKRLQTETDTVVSLRAEHDALTFRVTELESELRDAVESAAAALASTSTGEAEALWAVTTESCRRAWETSIAVVPDDPCPLDDPGAGLRTCIEIEVDAAREETGAPIELVWNVDVEPEPGAASLALAVVREVVARLGKHAAEATVNVAGGDGLVIVVDGVDDDGQALDLTGVAVATQVAANRWSMECAV